MFRRNSRRASTKKTVAKYSAEKAGPSGGEDVIAAFKAKYFGSVTVEAERGADVVASAIAKVKHQKNTPLKVLIIVKASVLLLVDRRTTDVIQNSSTDLITFANLSSSDAKLFVYITRSRSGPLYCHVFHVKDGAIELCAAVTSVVQHRRKMAHRHGLQRGFDTGTGSGNLSPTRAAASMLSTASDNESPSGSPARDHAGLARQRSLQPQSRAPKTGLQRNASVMGTPSSPGQQNGAVQSEFGFNESAGSPSVSRSGSARSPKAPRSPAAPLSPLSKASASFRDSRSGSVLSTSTVATEVSTHSTRSRRGAGDAHNRTRHAASLKTSSSSERALEKAVAFDCEYLGHEVVTEKEGSQAVTQAVLLNEAKQKRLAATMARKMKPPKRGVDSDPVTLLVTPFAVKTIERTTGETANSDFIKNISFTCTAKSEQSGDVFAYISHNEQLGRTICQLYRMDQGASAEVCQRIAQAFKAQAQREKERGSNPFAVTDRRREPVRGKLFYKQIHRADLAAIKPIGGGQFGDVYLAWQYVPKGKGEGGSNRIRRAVKILRNAATRDDKEEFLREAEVMVDLIHPHLVSFVGVALQQKPWLCVLEFMEYGDLRTVLRAMVDKGMNMSVGEQLDWCQQLASGMTYMAACRLVHMDLAARNCMLTANNLVKVGDFGLTRPLEPGKAYLRLRERLRLPLKWVAIEGMESRIFSELSDIWSFGVVMWEIFSYGETPYPGIHTKDIQQLVNDGLRLDPPSGCPSDVYDAMATCWDRDPRLRPAFIDLKRTLVDLKSNQPSIAHRDIGFDLHAIPSQGRSRSRTMSSISSKRSNVSNETATSNPTEAQDARDRQRSSSLSANKVAMNADEAGEQLPESRNQPPALPQRKTSLSISGATRAETSVDEGVVETTDHKCSFCGADLSGRDKGFVNDHLALCKEADDMAKLLDALEEDGTKPASPKESPKNARSGAVIGQAKAADNGPPLPAKKRSLPPAPPQRHVPLSQQKQQHQPQQQQQQAHASRLQPEPSTKAPALSATSGSAAQPPPLPERSQKPTKSANSRLTVTKVAPKAEQLTSQLSLSAESEKKLSIKASTSLPFQQQERSRIFNALNRKPLWHQTARERAEQQEGAVDVGRLEGDRFGLPASLDDDDANQTHHSGEYGFDGDESEEVEEEEEDFDVNELPDFGELTEIMMERRRQREEEAKRRREELKRQHEEEKRRQEQQTQELIRQIKEKEAREAAQRERELAAHLEEARKRAEQELTFSFTFN